MIREVKLGLEVRKGFGVADRGSADGAGSVPG